MADKFQLIRGKRILDQLLQEQKDLFERSSVLDLEKNAATRVPIPANRAKLANDPINITDLTLLPFIGTHNLNVTATATNNKNGHSYNPKMIFNNVEFEQQDLPTNVTFTAKDGQEYHCQQLELNNNTVRVHCNCMDFYWRFAAYNAKDQSLIGKPPAPYQRKTNRGPVNPQQVPGLCKHLLALTKELQRSGLVR